MYQHLPLISILLVGLWSAFAKGETTAEPSTSIPTIVFDGIESEGEQRIAKFRLTNPTTKTAVYLGPARNNPSFFLETPTSERRKMINFWEHWHWCGNCSRIRRYELAPGSEVEFRARVADNVVRFRIAAIPDMVGPEPQYCPVVNIK